MSDDIDKIKRELEEVRRLKEELRREVEEARRDRKETLRRDREELRAERERERERIRRERPPRAPRPPRRVRPIRELDVDLSGITDSLEDMMDGLGKSIEMSLKDVEGVGKNFRFPGVRIHKAGRKGRRVRKSDIEKIPPERVAKIVAPLGSEERLRIMEFLKTGGQNFKDIENATQKFGSSLTHHLNPLVDAGYVVKGEVRGMYYLTVEGRLAYRLAQWLTHRVESQRLSVGNNGGTEVDIDFDEDDEKVVIVEDEADLEKAAEHLDRVAQEVEDAQDTLEDVAERITDAKEEELDRLEELEEHRKMLEEERRERLEDLDDEDDLDDLDWED